MRACEPVGHVAVDFRRQKRAAVNVSTCRQIHVFLACRFNKDFDFLEILFSKFAGMLHFRRDTRELSHALVMQRRSTPLPEVIHAISKIV